MCLSLGISCPEGVRASAETSAGDVVNNRMCAQVFRLEGGTEMIREEPSGPPQTSYLDFWGRKCGKRRAEFQCTEHLLCVRRAVPAASHY